MMCEEEEEVKHFKIQIDICVDERVLGAVTFRLYPSLFPPLRESEAVSQDFLLKN